MNHFNTLLVVVKNNQLNILALLFFIALSHLGFSQNRNQFKKQISTVSDPSLKIELILTYTDSLLWNEFYTDDILSYLDEVIQICNTSDCGETLIHAKVSKLDFTMNNGEIDGALVQLKALLADPFTKTPSLKAYIHQLMGMYFLISGQSANKTNHFLKGIHILESDALPDRRLGLLYYYTAVLYNYKSLSDSCLYFGNKAMRYFETNADTIKLVITHLGFNNWYLTVGDPEKSFQSIFEAKKLSDQFELRDEIHFDILISMGLSHENRKEYTKAITIATKAIQRILKSTTLSDQEKALKLWNFYLMKGRSLMRTEQIEEGLFFIQKSTADCNENNLFPSLIIISKLFEIEAQLKLKNFEIARSILSVFIYDAENNPSYDVYNIKMIGLLTELYKSSNTRPKESELPILKKITKRIIEKNKGEFNYNLLTTYKLVALLQLNENRTIEVIATYDKINEIKDSIWSHKKTEAVDRLLISYQSKEQKQKIALQKERLKEAEIQRQLLLFLLSVLLLLIVFAFLFFWQRKQHISSLEKKVHERTYDLEVTNKELADSNEELERFAYITSHDLKEPLRNIISFIGLLEHKNLGNSGDAKVYFNFIKQNSIHMSRLIEDVLAFSILKKTEIVKKNVDVKDTIIKVQDTISQLINKKHVKFRVSALPIIKTDASMLYMVFKNLIENAVKYNENSAPVIEISYTEEENFYWFLVNDNGIGIEEEYFDQIFEMFKRLHNKEDYVGTGIGLAICKRTVNYLGGEIAVISKLNEGSVFKFSIPK